MQNRQIILNTLNEWLCPHLFKDYAPNGLQVQGKEKIQHLITGVTASEALIDYAINVQADAILVHHGLFWRNQSPCITGWLKRRLQKLLAHDINVFSYHLPLDAHLRLGNNAQLGKHLGFDFQATFGEQNLGFIGSILQPISLEQLTQHIQTVLRHPCTVVGNLEKRISTVAWCSGGAQSYFENAIAQNADVFITGEISEPQTHYARESGVAYIACGHHASERYGIQALGNEIAQQFDLKHQFIDIDNPA